MAEGIGGVAGLFQGPKHQIGQDALFGSARKFVDESLVVLRRDVDVRAREGDALLAFATKAAGFSFAGFCGRRHFAVADGDFPLVEVFDAERIAEGTGEFLEFEDFASVRFFVDTMERV
jgi:hypothetical protein